MSRVSPSTSDAPGLLFKTASKILPKIILVNITPDATLYRSGNRRLTEVIHILDINRNRLSKDEMRLHTAQFSEWVLVQMSLSASSKILDRMNDTAKDIESQFKRIPVDGQPLLSKKDLRNLVATFFLQAVALHDDVVVCMFTFFFAITSTSHCRYFWYRKLQGMQFFDLSQNTQWNVRLRFIPLRPTYW